MVESILTSTKESLGVPESHTAFDSAITMHINSALSTLAQIGVGPTSGLYVEDSVALWSDLIGTDNRLNMVRTYVYLRTKLLFDPPDIGFVLTAMKQQVEELEVRLNYIVDDEVLVTAYQPSEFTVILDGGVA